MNDEGTTNPRYEVDSPPSDFNFDTMLPGRVFTMAGEEYLYLEQQGANHMIMRHDPIRNTSFNEQPQVLSEWFSGLNAEVQAMVQPVLIPDPAPSLPMASITWADGQDGWLPANLASFPAAAADVTTVNPSGTVNLYAFFALIFSTCPQKQVLSRTLHNVRVHVPVFGGYVLLMFPTMLGL